VLSAIDIGAAVGAALLTGGDMDTKNKPGQKGESHTKQPTRPGSEQVRSGTSLERNQGERQQPKVGEAQKQKEGQIKGGKK
jgi:hypothetical protein